MKRPPNRDELTMTSEAIARDWVIRIERRESDRSGLPLSDARKVAARKAGIAPGTLENLRKGRVKRVAVSVFERLRTAVIRDLQNEIVRCTHELEMARQCGLDPRSSDVAALEAAICAAERLIGGK